ncbi:MAG: ribulose-phosphate 3-epimerase, partial [Pirellulaceae bacterium]
TDMPLDVHLMIAQPQRYVSQFADAGADVLTVHIEAVNDPVAVLDAIRERGLAAGIAINPDTPWELLSACVGHCDLVLVMSVPAGFGGQRFRPDALARLQRAREQFGPQVVLEVDGGVNADTIGDCVAAGAQWLVVGSAIFRAPRYDEAVRALEARWKRRGTDVSG